MNGENAKPKEYWDAYDEQFNRIKGAVLVRGEPIPQGMLHLVCDILVRHADGEYLLMRRDPRKENGNLWEASAGGSALRGETPEQCARRELREETGVSRGEFTPVATVIDRADQTIYAEFLCVTDVAKDSITLQEGETVDYRWVSRDALLSMKRSELVTERMQRYLDELKAR